MGLGTTLARLRRDQILDALERSGWRTTHAAKALEIHSRTLKQEMQAFGLTRPATARRSRPRATEFRKVAPWTWEAIAP
jgi:DNA-binding NtrC family response regulator